MHIATHWHSPVVLPVTINLPNWQAQLLAFSTHPHSPNQRIHIGPVNVHHILTYWHFMDLYCQGCRAWLSIVRNIISLKRSSHCELYKCQGSQEDWGPVEKRDQMTFCRASWRNPVIVFLAERGDPRTCKYPIIGKDKFLDFKQDPSSHKCSKPT